MPEQGISAEKIKEYAGNVQSIASAVESLFKHDGFNIFFALYSRKKREIERKDDYATLEDFKADRRAVKIVDDLLEEMRSYIADAETLQGKLKEMLPEEESSPRGILLIERVEGREG